MNKKVTIRLLLMLTLTSAACMAQRTGDVGYAPGIVNYVGDLANEKYFPFSSTNVGLQLTFRNFLNNPEKSLALYQPLSLELRFSWHRLQYDEVNAIGNSKGMQLR